MYEYQKLKQEFSDADVRLSPAPVLSAGDDPKRYEWAV